MIDDDEGSTIPLILGFFIVALLMVAASIALGDAFVQQRDLQSLCDGAAIAAASSADVQRQREGQSPVQRKYLQLANVQAAVNVYLARDPARSAVRIDAEISTDLSVVAVVCAEDTAIAFGSFFRLSKGIHHRVTSSARAPQTL